MEAALLHSSADHQSMAPSKSERNPKTIIQTRSFIPSRSHSGNLNFENLPKKEMMVKGGVFLNTPFPLSSSLPRLNSSPYPLQFHQPPLLPLPMASSSRQLRSLPTSGGSGGSGGCSRGSSTSPTHKKQKKVKKDQTNTKPSKQTTSPQKVTNANSIKQYPAAKSDLSAVGNTKRLGPDPDSLPKDTKRVLFGDDTTVIYTKKEEVQKFSGSVFPLAPPPSSLPMPKFSLKPKRSCKVEATSAVGGGWVDTGATDSLCRLLNLH